MLSGYLHDAVLMWAYAVNRTLERGFPPDHGREVIKSILGFSFEGITGSLLIDNNGDRMNDMDILITQNGKVSVDNSYWYINWSHVDKQHIQFFVSLPVNAAQGSQHAAPIGRG